MDQTFTVVLNKQILFKLVLLHFITVDSLRETTKQWEVLEFNFH